MLLMIGFIFSMPAEENAGHVGSDAGTTPGRFKPVHQQLQFQTRDLHRDPLNGRATADGVPSLDDTYKEKCLCLQIIEHTNSIVFPLCMFDWPINNLCI